MKYRSGKKLSNQVLIDRFKKLVQGTMLQNEKIEVYQDQLFAMEEQKECYADEIHRRFSNKKILQNVESLIQEVEE